MMEYFKCLDQVLSINNIYLFVQIKKQNFKFNKTFFEIKIIYCILII